MILLNAATAEQITEEELLGLREMLRGHIGYLADLGKVQNWVYIVAVVFFALLGYFLGSMNFAVIISKIKFGEDIRTKGSGNAGATNMSRTYGKAAGAATLVGDILKAVLPVFIAKMLVGEMFGYLTGLACALGHAFPCYYKFKGGKCVAVTAAVILVMEPLAFLFLALIFAVVVFGTKYVSLGSVFTALISPVILHNFVSARYGKSHIGLVFIIIQCLLVVYLHKANIKRLIDGKENKFSFKKKKDGTNVKEK